MKTDRDVEILAGRPDWVVVRSVDMRKLPQIHRRRRKHDTPVSSANGALYLYSRLSRCKWNEALRDEALAIGGPLVDEPIVVCLDTSELKIRVC
jgi:hypothetical protein